MHLGLRTSRPSRADPLQELLRRCLEGTAYLGQRIKAARTLLDHPPKQNWFKRGEDLHLGYRAGGDAGQYDLLLHSQDRVYTVVKLTAVDLITHSFFSTRRADTAAKYGDGTATPLFVNDPISGAEFVQLIRNHGGKPGPLVHRSGLNVMLDPLRYVAEILKHLDGNLSFGQIFAAVREVTRTEPSDELLFSELKPGKRRYA